MNTSERTYTYKAHLIRRTVFGKYVVASLPWGDQPGEVSSFRTLYLAQEFIDRQTEERSR